jgi:hypothetical protein
MNGRSSLLKANFSTNSQQNLFPFLVPLSYHVITFGGDFLIVPVVDAKEVMLALYLGLHCLVPHTFSQVSTIMPERSLFSLCGLQRPVDH